MVAGVDDADVQILDEQEDVGSEVVWRPMPMWNRRDLGGPFWPHRAMSRCDTSTKDAQHFRNSAQVEARMHGSHDLLLIRMFRWRYLGTE
jgi:hypothetical protein